MMLTRKIKIILTIIIVIISPTITRIQYYHILILLSAMIIKTKIIITRMITRNKFNRNKHDLPHKKPPPVTPSSDPRK